MGPMYGCRKITQEIARAFEAGKPRTVGNTYTDGTMVYLHGHAILKRENGKLYFTLAGWNTTTTKERLKPWVRVYNVKRIPHVNGAEIEVDKWYPVPS